MSEARDGDTVQVHYTGTLNDGSEFDSSRGRDPLQFTLGSGQVIPGFEQAIRGMQAGDSKTVTIPAAEAYGERNETMVQEVPREAIPGDIDLEEGLVLHARSPEGQTLQFTVVEFDDSSVRIDGNHPLAGRDLTFALDLVAIV